jgi:hypothetical protein
MVAVAGRDMDMTGCFRFPVAGVMVLSSAVP